MELDFNDYTRLKCAVPEGLHEYESFFSDDNTDYLLYINDDAAEPCAVVPLTMAKNRPAYMMYMLMKICVIKGLELFLLPIF